MDKLVLKFENNKLTIKNSNFKEKVVIDLYIKGTAINPLELKV